MEEGGGGGKGKDLDNSSVLTDVWDSPSEPRVRGWGAVCMVPPPPQKSNASDEVHRFDQVKDVLVKERSSGVLHGQSCSSASESRGRSVSL